MCWQMMKMLVAERRGLRVVVTLLICLGILTGLCTYAHVGLLRPTVENARFAYLTHDIVLLTSVI